MGWKQQGRSGAVPLPQQALGRSQMKRALAPAGTRARCSRGTTLIPGPKTGPSFHQRPSSVADRPAIGCPANGGLPERATCWGPSPPRSFTRRLRGELQRASPEGGSQSPASPPWRVPSAYSSPSQPLARYLLWVGIMPQKPCFVKPPPSAVDGRPRRAGSRSPQPR